MKLLEMTVLKSSMARVEEVIEHATENTLDIQSPMGIKNQLWLTIF